eukprot:m.468780 g.468780  ORF g.468780 m.468780 type:complete len:761 (-) comp21647_c1_seq4:409-2691(-)
MNVEPAEAMSASKCNKHRIVFACRGSIGWNAAKIVGDLWKQAGQYQGQNVLDFLPQVDANARTCLRLSLIKEFMLDFNNHSDWDTNTEEYARTVLGITFEQVQEWAKSERVTCVGLAPIENREMIQALSVSQLASKTAAVFSKFTQELSEDASPVFIHWDDLSSYQADVVVLCGHGETSFEPFEDKRFIEVLSDVKPIVVIGLLCNMCSSRGDMSRLAHYPDHAFVEKAPIFVGFERVITTGFLKGGVGRLLAKFLAFVTSSVEQLNHEKTKVYFAVCVRECDNQHTNLAFFNDRPRFTTQNRLMEIIAASGDGDDTNERIFNGQFDSWGYCKGSDIIPIAKDSIDVRLMQSKSIRDTFVQFLKCSAGWETWLLNHVDKFRSGCWGKLLETADNKENVFHFTRAMVAGFTPGFRDSTELIKNLLAPLYQQARKLKIAGAVLQAGLASINPGLAIGKDDIYVVSSDTPLSAYCETVSHFACFSHNHLEDGSLLYDLQKWRYKLLEPCDLFLAVNGTLNQYKNPSLRSHLSIEKVDLSTDLPGFTVVATSQAKPVCTSHKQKYAENHGIYTQELFSDVVNRMATFYRDLNTQEGEKITSDDDRTNWNLEEFTNTLLSRGFHFAGTTRAVESRAAARQYSTTKPNNAEWDCTVAGEGRLYDATLARCRFVLAGKHPSSKRLLLFYTDVHYGDDLAVLFPDTRDVYSIGATVNNWKRIDEELLPYVDYPLRFVAVVKLQDDGEITIEGPRDLGERMDLWYYTHN